MDPQVSTSFIPKAALTQEKARAGGMGLFFLIALLVFIISLVAAGLAFGYQRFLQGEITKNKAMLDVQKGAFDPATIQQLVRIDSRIEQAKQLLQKHVAPSGIFDYLAQNTLTSVQFTGLQYILNADQTATVRMDGNTDSFGTIALQSDALGKNNAFKDVIFSDITVQPGGRVGFTVQASIDPGLISYTKQISGAGAPTQ